MLSLSPAMPGLQAADAARDDVDGHARTRRDVQRLDDLLVDERVDLQSDPRRLARARGGRDPLDLLQDPVAEEPRPDEQLAEHGRPREPGDGVEDVGDIRGDVRVRGEQPQVLVGRCVRRVVVPGADVDVAPQAVLLVPDEQGELRVDLQVRDAVDDVDAGALERPRPLDVAPLVEARLQLDEADGLLPLLCGLHE